MGGVRYARAFVAASLLTLAVGSLPAAAEGQATVGEVGEAAAAAADLAPLVLGGDDEFDEAPAVPLLTTALPAGVVSPGGEGVGTGDSGSGGSGGNGDGGGSGNGGLDGKSRMSSASAFTLAGFVSRLSSAGAAGSGAALDAKQVWYFERIVAALCVAYVGVFLCGKAVNERVAGRWATTLTEAVDGEFAAVGVDSVGTKLHKDGQGVFHFYASGRRHAAALTCTLTLKRRYDLFTVLQTPVGRSDADRCALLLTLPDGNGGGGSGLSGMEPLMWALVRKREVKRFRRANRVLEALAGQVAPPAGAWADAFVALSDRSGSR